MTADASVCPTPHSAVISARAQRVISVLSGHYPLPLSRHGANSATITIQPPVQCGHGIPAKGNAAALACAVTSAE